MTAPFVHPLGVCESPHLGPGTRVWAFAHVLPGARIGAECNICDHVFVENDVVVGDRVTVKCGVQLWDGVRIEDDVFIGPNVTFTNDPFPRSRRWQAAPAATRIARGASIGANATILPGLTIGANAMVGAASVVTANVPANAIVRGNPARIVGYVDAVDPSRETADDGRTVPHLTAADPVVAGVRRIVLSHAADARGEMAIAEAGADLPFVPRRVLTLFNVAGSAARGERAYRRGEHVFVCVKGSCTLLVDDGERRQEFTLDRPTEGILVPPFVWTTHYRYAEGAVLLVLASEPWREEDRIDGYDAFLAARAEAIPIT